MGIVALFAFWTVVIRLWIVDGPKIPVIFIVFWIAALLAVNALGGSGYVFLSIEAMLAVILLIVERYKSAMP